LSKKEISQITIFLFFLHQQNIVIRVITENSALIFLNTLADFSKLPEDKHTFSGWTHLKPYSQQTRRCWLATNLLFYLSWI